MDLPDPGLFWNRRTPHMKLARLKKESRRLGFLAIVEAMKTADLPETGVLWRGYKLEPHYPNNRRRDDDNLGGACKGVFDGIFVDYLRVDDSKVRNMGTEPTIDKGCNPHLIIHLYYDEL